VKPIEKKEEVAVVDTLSGTNNAEAADSTLINDTIQE
jgi:hypothetical protein